MMCMRLFAPALAVVVIASGCGGGDRPSSGARPSSTAAISIIEPEHNATIDTDTLTVRTELTGGTISSEVSTNLTPDEGHVHVKIDGKTLTLNSGLEEEIDAPEPGSHLLEVEFVASDHGPFNPRVLDTITFEVT